LSRGGRTYIGNWSNPNDVVVWHFELPAAGTYRVQVEGKPASEPAVGQRVRVTAGGQKLVGKIGADGVVFDQPLVLKAGKVSLSVELVDAKRTGPAVLDLSSLKLVPESK